MGSEMEELIYCTPYLLGFLASSVSLISTSMGFISTGCRTTSLLVHFVVVTVCGTPSLMLWTGPEVTTDVVTMGVPMFRSQGSETSLRWAGDCWRGFRPIQGSSSRYCSCPQWILESNDNNDIFTLVLREKKYFLLARKLFSFIPRVGIFHVFCHIFQKVSYMISSWMPMRA